MGNSHKNFSSETTGPIATKLWWNDPWMAPFQNCFQNKFGCGGHLGRSSEMPDTIWKRTTHESFQQSLVEIGSVVSEKNFFFNFIPSFF
jgi:hypothetical protein